MMIDDSIRVHPTQFLQKKKCTYDFCQFNQSVLASLCVQKLPSDIVLCSGDSMMFGDTFPLSSKTVSN
jgi:hypothetical protein